jgi:tetratricopeptide (TPR) repeat protein
MIKLGSKTIDIPAGHASYAVTDAYTLPVDVDLLSVYPHAHYLAAEMVATATLPDGTERRLLRVKRWDFRWQQDYRYATPIVLPRGTTLRMRYTYDNSPRNPHNPHDPPRQVTYGPQSHDEFNLAGALSLTGATGDAISELQRTVDLNPEFAEARNNLGVLLGMQGRFAMAVRHLERAVHLSPDYPDAHSSLGAALASVGQVDRALIHLRRALDLRPDDRRAAGYLRLLLERRPALAR